MSTNRLYRAPTTLCSTCRRRALHSQFSRPFSSSTQRRAISEDSSSTPATNGNSATPNAAGRQSSDVKNALTNLVQRTPAWKDRSSSVRSQTTPQSSTEAPPAAADIQSALLPSFRPPLRSSRAKGKPSLRDILGTDGIDASEEWSKINARLSAKLSANEVPPHRLHIYSHKRNTHMTLVQAPRLATDTVSSEISKTTTVAAERKKMVDVLLSMSTGEIGFRKAGRGTYDAAFQLGAHFFKQMKERGMYKDLARLDLVIRGFGPGREAIKKLIMGTEGTNLRERIVSISDATRIKIGGCRSRKATRKG